MTTLHRMLRRQVEKSRGATGEIDIDALLDTVSRTYTEDEEDLRRTDRSIQLMVDELEAANQTLRHTSSQLQVTLEAIRHGIIMVSQEAQIDVCNSMARELLRLPESCAEGSFPYSRLARYLRTLDVLENIDDRTALIAAPGGLEVEIHVHPTSQGGTVILVEDVTGDRNRERALRQAETEYRSLFENSVLGIYRDQLDGTPVRANPAFVAMNGYASEAELIEAVTRNPNSWYVDPDRGNQVLETLKQEGRVRDLISQLYRHRTREPVWVTENAWYVRDENGTPLFIEGTMQDAGERMAAEEAMKRLVNVDLLTGAKSRFRFMQRLEEEVSRPNNSFVLYCLDLDMFKDVNDVFGHAAGDAVLKAVTERLNRLAGGDAVVARLGGDEFAILSGAERDLEDPALMAQNIVDAMRDAVSLEGRNHHIGASVGIALFPQHGATRDELLRNADTALYGAKAGGRNGWRLFDQELRLALERRKEIEENLRSAVQRNELELHYQPIICMADGSISGYEGLMRWNSARLGRVPPGDFIPVAEQAGLMGRLGSWAITRACEDASTFANAVRFGVNVSANQFREPGFLPFIEKEFTRFGVSPERLVLEITESVLVSNESVARNLLDGLRKLGVQIAIDDFGTGYSSLSYLQHLPINTVKIDRSFVAGILAQKANRSIIRAILAIGDDLGFKIIAEGVETEEQAQALRNEGCQYVQGFLYNRPKPLLDVMADFAASSLDRRGALHLVKSA